MLRPFERSLGNPEQSNLSKERFIRIVANGIGYLSVLWPYHPSGPNGPGRQGGACYARSMNCHSKWFRVIQGQIGQGQNVHHNQGLLVLLLPPGIQSESRIQIQLHLSVLLLDFAPA